jgi:acyl carrier protein
MQPAEFYALLDEMLELDAGTLTGTERLDDLENWDSLAVISFIALVDEHFNILIESDKLSAAETAGDLLALATQQKPA